MHRPTLQLLFNVLLVLAVGVLFSLFPALWLPP